MVLVCSAWGIIYGILKLILKTWRILMITFTWLALWLRRRTQRFTNWNLDLHIFVQTFSISTWLRGTTWWGASLYTQRKRPIPRGIVLENSTGDFSQWFELCWGYLETSTEEVHADLMADGCQIKGERKMIFGEWSQLFFLSFFPWASHDVYFFLLCWCDEKWGRRVTFEETCLSNNCFDQNS